MDKRKDQKEDDDDEVKKKMLIKERKPLRILITFMAYGD